MKVISRWPGGTSAPARIAFLRGILEESELQGLKPAAAEMMDWNDGFIQGGHDGLCGNGDDYYFAYFGERQSCGRNCNLGNESWRVDLIDTWEMTITPLGTFTGRCFIPLPRKTHVALRFVKEK